MKDKSNSRSQQHSLKLEILFIVFLFISVYLFFCLISYSPNDAKSMSMADGHVQNYGGQLGVVLSLILIDLLGLFSYLFVALIFIFLMISIFKTSARNYIKNIFILILSGLIIPTIFSLIQPKIIIHGFEIRSGGMIGEFFKIYFVRYFNRIPALVMLLSIFFIMFYGIWNAMVKRFKDSSSKKDKLRLIQNKMPEASSKKPFSDLCEISSRDLFENVLLENEDLFANKNRSIQSDFCDEMLIVKVNEELIKNILVKLISNAIKYSSKGDIICTLRNVGNKWVEFSVSDCGKGIKYSRQMDLFLPIQHENDATNNNTSGSIFCLRICKEIIEAHGGEIWVESELGSGSRFVFLLPTND